MRERVWWLVLSEGGGGGVKEGEGEGGEEEEEESEGGEGNEEERSLPSFSWRHKAQIAPGLMVVVVVLVVW